MQDPLPPGQHLGDEGCQTALRGQKQDRPACPWQFLQLTLETRAATANSHHHFGMKTGTLRILSENKSTSWVVFNLFFFQVSQLEWELQLFENSPLVDSYHLILHMISSMFWQSNRIGMWSYCWQLFWTSASGLSFASFETLIYYSLAQASFLRPCSSNDTLERTSLYSGGVCLLKFTFLWDQSTGFGVGPSMWPWARTLTPLNSSLLFCKMQIITLPGQMTIRIEWSNADKVLSVMTVTGEASNHYITIKWDPTFPPI